MDLLGSILNSMDKPPVMSDTQKAIVKKQHEEFKKHKQAEAEIFKKFREKIEEKVNNFLKDDFKKEYKFSPMDQVCRSIIYDVCEVANILAFSFGEEGIDKHVIIFKKEHAPSEDHLNTLRRGEEWNEDIAEKLKEQREKYLKQEEEKKCRTKKHKFIPNSNYKDKYKHLIGIEAALEAAKKTEANSSYGYEYFGTDVRGAGLGLLNVYNASKQSCRKLSSLLNWCPITLLYNSKLRTIITS